MPDAFKALSANALQLTGGPQSPPAARRPPPACRSVYGVRVALGEQPRGIAEASDLPDAINVSASYAVVVLKCASAQATNLAEYSISKDGQTGLTRHRFSPR